MPEVPAHSDHPRALVDDGQNGFSDLGERAVAEHASDGRDKSHTRSSQGGT
jgi:hypothetical protein